MKSIIVVLLLTGCAGANYRPLVDRPGTNYERDLRECQTYAQGEPDAVQGAAFGAVIGALLGAVIGHGTGFGNNFAAAGAIGGALGAGSRANQDQMSIIKNCMAGRGHSVLR